ncbi:hypothetical protein Y032_0004g2239 [Ancylostoma ceylanicum]|uniref:Reverse transcriptase domain-containing protein n=1 Tax=Ancylostoma ceylanicum TaxID=53326 RepID=A0A016VW36_9BILA|nr:hypothetical protein Y032_0004g2239 [Ancylostoma ceylanicum]
MFLNRLRTTTITDDCIMEAFDVNALYTNVSNDSVMQAIFELLSQHVGFSTYATSESVPQLQCIPVVR